MHNIFYKFKSAFFNLTIAVSLLIHQNSMAAKNTKVNESRIMNGTLWVEQIKIPMTQGAVVYIDSVFALFIPKRKLSRADAHENIVLQIQDTNKQLSHLAKVVEFDAQNSWMLAEIKKQDIQAPKQKLSAEQVVEIVLRNQLIKDKEKQDLLSTLQRFEKDNYKRALAEQKSFSELMEVQIKNFADKLTEMLLKSTRKVQWSENAALLLPGVDSCVQDYEFKRKMKKFTSSTVKYSYHCSMSKKTERDVATDIKPDLQIFAGVISTEEPYLRVPSVTNRLNEASQFLNPVVSEILNGSSTCQMYWISERNIFAKSCVEKSDSFKNLYTGVHYFGYYQGQKIIYQALFLKDFAEQNHKDIVQKFLKETKGNVL
jgi:hypothetical protein